MAHPWHALARHADAAAGTFRGVAGIPRGPRVERERHETRGRTTVKIDRLLGTEEARETAVSAVALHEEREGCPRARSRGRDRLP